MVVVFSSNSSSDILILFLLSSAANGNGNQYVCPFPPMLSLASKTVVAGYQFLFRVIRHDGYGLGYGLRCPGVVGGRMGLIMGG